MSSDVKAQEDGPMHRGGLDETSATEVWISTAGYTHARKCCCAQASTLISRGVEGGWVIYAMHGRSDTPACPFIPTLLGRSTSGFDRPGKRCLHQARSAVRYSSNRMPGEPNPTKNRLRGECCYTWMAAFNCFSLVCNVASSRDGNAYPRYVTAPYMPCERGGWGGIEPNV